MKRKWKTTPFRSHEAATIESFHNDPGFAAEYLNAVLADGDQDEVMLALRRLSQAFGGVAKVAKTADLNATTLYRTLSPKGNPEMKSLTTPPCPWDATGSETSSPEARRVIASQHFRCIISGTAQNDLENCSPHLNVR